MKILLKDSDMFFHSNKEHLKKDLLQVIILAFAFSLLTTATMFAGLTTVKPAFGFIASLVAIFLSSVIGMLVIAFVLGLLLFRKADRKSFGKAFFVVGYAATPIFIIGWIPHGVVKLVAIVWSLVFVFNGIQIKTNKSQKESALLVIVLCIILAALTLLSQNYLISPI